MDLPDLSALGALGVPAFVAIFLLGWGACYSILVKPLTTRVEALEEDIEAHRKEKDAELQALRQKVLG